MYIAGEAGGWWHEEGHASCLHMYMYNSSGLMLIFWVCGLEK